MSTWAVPGAKCVCVDDQPLRGKVWHGDGPKTGATYTIRSIFNGPDGNLSASFVELERSDMSKAGFPGQLVGYRLSRFRPLTTRIQSEDVALFRKLLVTEGADA